MESSVPLSNYEIFSECVSPILPLRPCPNASRAVRPQCRTKTPCSCGCLTHSSLCEYFLRDLWRFYDLPFGLEVPIINLPVSRVHFIPYVSGMQLFLYKDSLESFSHLLPPTQPLIFDDAALVFEFFEFNHPEVRIPFPEQIHSLSSSCRLLSEATSSMLHPRSWYSVLWYPVLCDKNTISYLKGSFISYHGFLFDENAAFACICRPPSTPPVISNLLQVLPLSSIIPSNHPLNVLKGTVEGEKTSEKAGNSGFELPTISRTVKSLQALLPCSCFVANKLYPFGVIPSRVNESTWFSSDSSSQWEKMLLENPRHFLTLFNVVHPDFEHANVGKIL
ncbi:hypothetical protein RCL1_005144 [Eukaryota sp. TZLM3-RCL]